MKHKHYDVMMEWAADTGKVVQSRVIGKGTQWFDCSGAPCWDTNMVYRIKPETKSDFVRFFRIEASGATSPTNGEWTSNLRLTFSGEDGSLIEAEVL